MKGRDLTEKEKFNFVVGLYLGELNRKIRYLENKKIEWDKKHRMIAFLKRIKFL